MSLDWVLLGLRITATIIIYTFLGVAFYIIWRDLKWAQAQNASAPLLVTSHRLRVVNPAADGTLAKGQILPLQPVTLLGRSADNTIVLRDTSASGQHARLSCNDGVWWLEDLGSKNGTTLNDLPLSKPAPLTNGDVIGIGNLKFRLELDDAS
jgi:hypothetical protein